MKKDDEETESTWVKIARQITTPIALLALTLVCLTIAISSLADCEIQGAFKGCLLLIALLGFLVISGASIAMAVWLPRQLTFDKDAHLAVGVELRKDQASDLIGFGKLLTLIDKDGEVVQKLAEAMRLVDEGDERAAEDDSTNETSVKVIEKHEGRPR